MNVGPAFFSSAAAPSNVVLLAHFDGDFSDSSPYARTLTAHGGVATTPTNAWDAEGATFNGTTGYLSTPDTGNFIAGPRIWSVDFRFYIPTATSLATDNVVVGQWAGSGNLGWLILIGASGELKFYYSPDGSSASFTTLSAGLSRDTPYHGALWRSPTSDVIRCAVDGVRTPFTLAAGTDVFDTPVDLTIGATADPTAFMKSGVVIDELRICVDTIDYADADFTPPSAPYT